MEKGAKKIITYLVITILLSSYFYYKLISVGRLNGYVFGLMWVPAVSAIITKIIFDRSLKGLGWKFAKLKYLAASYFIPLLSALVVYAFVWIAGLGEVTKPQIITILGLSTLGVIMSCGSAIGEEIGWRGFLVPELNKKYSYIKTSIITAIIWYLYHCPIIIFTDYNNGVSVGYSMIFFGITITSFSFICNYLRIKSGSMWTGVIMHASHNLFIQSIFDVITIDTGYTKYITTEFGIGLAIVYTMVAVWFIRKADKLNKEEINLQATY